MHNVIRWISDQKVETVESDASSAANDASTTAACPTGYTLIGTQITHYIHSRALFRVACSRSPLSKGSIFLQPAQDTAREQVTFYLTSSDIARGPERHGTEHLQIISVLVKSPSASA